MTLKFVELPAFTKAWKDMKLTDYDLFELESRLLMNPHAGRVIKNSGGARKVRFELYGKGKSSGARVIYVYAVVDKTIYFLYAYPKSIKDNLTEQETANIRKSIVILRSI